MVRGILTILTFLVSTTVLGIIAIVVGLVSGRRTVIFRLGRTWAIWFVAMSHNTTSWKSHSRTWRWIAGNEGRSPEGGKARR